MIARSVFAAAIAAAALVACSSDDDNHVVVSSNPTDATGQLTLHWTIDGSTNASGCTSTDSASFYVAVTDANGTPVDTFETACAAFETSITLPPGSYAATARLVDNNNSERTTAVPVASFTLVGGDTLVQNLDFPTSSFY